MTINKDYHHHFNFRIPDRMEELEDRENFSNFYTVDCSKIHNPAELTARIDEAERSFKNKGPNFIVENFDYFYFTIKFFKEIDIEQQYKAWTILNRSLYKLYMDLNEFINENYNLDERRLYQNKLQMIIYAFIMLSELFEKDDLNNNNVNDNDDNNNQQQRKKRNKLIKSSRMYQESKPQSITSLLQLLSLRLDRIFETSHFIASFINIITRWLYHIIEYNQGYRLRQSQYFTNICEIITVAIDRYEHGINFCMKIIEILQTKESTSSILSDLVAYIIRRLPHQYIVYDIIEQIKSIDISTILSKDNSAQRAISTFLIELGEKCTDNLYKFITDLFDFLEQDSSYVLRNATLEIITIIIIKKFRSPLIYKDIHIKMKLLDKLEEHIHDITSYTRSRVLQLWCQLAEQNAIPIERLSIVIELIIGRLNDKSCFVRKNAMHFLTTILKENTFTIMNKKDMLKLMEKTQRLSDELIESMKSFIENHQDDDDNVDEHEHEHEHGLKRKNDEYENDVYDLILKSKKSKKNFDLMEKLANDWVKLEKSFQNFWKENSVEIREKIKNLSIPDDLPQDNLKDGLEFFRNLFKNSQFRDALVALFALKSLYPNEKLFHIKSTDFINDDDVENKDDEVIDSQQNTSNIDNNDVDYDEFLNTITNSKTKTTKLSFELTLAKRIFLAPLIELGNTNFDDETNSQKQMIENILNDDQKCINNNKTKITPEMFQNSCKKIKQYAMLNERLKCAIKIMTSISDDAIPIICVLLNSRNTTDIQEAINFFTQAYRMEIDQSILGVQKMLKLIFNREKTIRDALIDAFTEIYLNHSPTTNIDDDNLNDDNDKQLKIQKSKHFMEIKHLSDMILKLNQGELICVEAIINELYAAKKFNQIHLQILWERYAKKYSRTTDEDSRAALIIIGMLSSAQQQSLMNESNLDNIIKISLQPPHSLDHRFVADTCDVLLKSLFKLPPIETMEKFYKLSTDHLLFQRLTIIMVESISNLQSKYWLRMSAAIIKVIYYLADKPDLIITKMIDDCYNEILNKSKFDQNKEQENETEAETESLTSILNTTQNNNVIIVGQVNDLIISRFISMLGDIAINLLIHLDLHLKKELKIRQYIIEKKKNLLHNNKKNKNKNKSNDTNNDDDDDDDDDMDLMLGPNNNDDPYQEQIAKICNESILFENGILKKFAPLIERIATDYEGNCYSYCLRQSSSLTLAKFMALSLKFTRKNRAILADILEKSIDSEIRSNAIISFGDLLVRFPNDMEHFTKKIFHCLNDENFNVKNNALIVLTRLILSDMIKATGNISKIAQLIIDDNLAISSSARLFFVELGKKNNVLIYNYLPDIISNLSGTNGLVETKFHDMIKFLFELLEKTRNTESLVSKLCRRFSETTDERTWRDLSYCLSQLQYNERSLDKLMDNFPYYSNTLLCDEIFDNFMTILNTIRKNTTTSTNTTNTNNIKSEIKIRLDEMETKIKDFRTKAKENSVQQQQQQQKNDQDENNINPSNTTRHQKVETKRTTTVKKTKPINKQINATTTTTNLRKSKRIRRRIITESDDDSDNADNDNNDHNDDDEFIFNE